jgi:hypothetical protein
MVATETYAKTGFEIADAVGAIGRKIGLMGAGTRPPPPAEDGGLPLPDWMGKHDKRDRQRSLVTWISRNLDLVNHEIAALGDPAKDDPAKARERLSLEAQRSQWRERLETESKALDAMGG